MKHLIQYIVCTFILFLLTVSFAHPSNQMVLAQESIYEDSGSGSLSGSDVDPDGDTSGDEIDPTDESYEAVLSSLTCLSEDTKNTLLENPENISCLQVVNECVNTHLKVGASSMTELLKNPSATSDLLPIAVDLYRAMEDEAYDALSVVLSVRRLRETHGEKIVEEYPACQNFLDQIYKEGMRPFFRDYLLENAQRKRSYILVDKYKQINSQLGNLNTMIAQWYGNITSFTEKLPALSKYCQ